ncbi:MAG: hypothetical protein HFF49_05260 [Lawsonibacter sp.]|jgi:predicted permease|nr:hypothetical protein [Lawsonibacter sp.]
MDQVYSKASALILAVAIGYWLKETERFSADSPRFLSWLVLHITLPCVIIKSLSGISLSLQLLKAAVWGTAVNSVLLLLALLLFWKKDTQTRLAALFSLTTFNITNYIVPILNPFTSPTAMAGIFAFNLPTSAFTYAVVPICAGFLAPPQKVTGRVAMVLQRFFHSTPTMVCIVMFLLAAMRISIPSSMLDVVKVFADANTFLAMLVVGSLVELPRSWRNSLCEVELIGIRLCAVCGMAAALWWMAPVQPELNRALIMALFAPAASCCPILALDCGYQGKQIAAVNSMYLLISVGILSVLTCVMN